MHVASLHDRNESGRLPGRELLFADCFLRARLFFNIDDRKSQIVHAVAGVADPGYNALSFHELFDVIGDAMEFLRPHDKIDMR